MVFISFIHLCFSDSDPFFRQQIVRRGGFVSHIFYFISFTSSVFNSVVLLFGSSIFIHRLSKEEIGGSGGGGHARQERRSRGRGSHLIQMRWSGKSRGDSGAEAEGRLRWRHRQRWGQSDGGGGHPCVARV